MGAASGSVTTDSAGNYAFNGLFNGNYTVAPSRSDYAFSPSGRNVSISGSSTSAQNFTGTPLPTLFDFAWQLKAPMPVVLNGSAVAVYNNKIHVIDSCNRRKLHFKPLQI